MTRPVDRNALAAAAMAAGLPRVHECLARLTRGRVRVDHGAFPEDLEIEDGYPSDARVDEIGCVSIRDADRWLREVLPEAVNAMSYGGATAEQVPDWLGDSMVQITVTTGGWSGVETVIDAVLDHPIMRLRLVEQYRGGKYVFHVPPSPGMDQRQGA